MSDEWPTGEAAGQRRNEDDDYLLTVTEVAEIMEVHRATVLNWINKGRWPRKLDGEPGVVKLFQRYRLWASTVEALLHGKIPDQYKRGGRR